MEDENLHPLKIDASMGTQLEESNILTIFAEDGYEKTDVVDLLQHKSFGVMQFFELVYGLRKSEAEPYASIREEVKSGKSPVILGLGAGKEDRRYRLAAMTFKGDRWQSAYDELGIDLDNLEHTKPFMEKITEKDSPYDPVIFLVPKDFQKRHPSAMGGGGSSQADPVSVTYKEFKYFLDNPERARRVLFVFGGNEYFDTSKLGSKSDEDVANLYNQRLDQLFDFLEAK